MGCQEGWANEMGWANEVVLQGNNSVVLICKAKQKCINLHLFVFIIQVILSSASNLITHSIKDGVAVIKFDTPDSKVCVFLVNYLVNNTVIITTYFNPDYFSCFMWIL